MGMVVLWNPRRHVSAVVAIFVAFLAYYAVVTFHFTGASFLVRRPLDQ